MRIINLEPYTYKMEDYRYSIYFNNKRLIVKSSLKECDIFKLVKILNEAYKNGYKECLIQERR